MQYYPIGFRPKELSVRTAMKEIAESKVAMAQADMAPTLVEKTKKLWEWEQKDRPLTRELKEQTVTKGRQDIATTERAKLLKAMSDARDILTWANEATTDEEFNKRLESAKPVYSKEHKDYVTGEGGEDLIDLNKITRESAQTTLGWLDEKTNTIMKPGDIKITERGGEIISEVQAAFKPDEGKEQSWLSTDKEGKQWITTLNADGTATTVAVEGTTGKPLVGRTEQDVMDTTKPEFKSLREQHTATKNVVDLSKFLQTQAKSNPTVLGFLGGTQKRINSVYAQLKMTAKSLGGSAEVDGKTVNESSLIDPDRYHIPSLGKTATEQARFKSIAVRLAYCVARAQDPSGRLSDRDVDNALQQIGGSAQSLEQLVGSLDAVVRNTTQGYYNQYEAVMGEAIPEEDKFDIAAFGGDLPEGIPFGSILQGTKDGKPVYLSPEGKRLMVTK